MEKYQVLLFYKFVEIEDPESFTKDHLKYCQELGLLGRIYIASEGINGTLSGTISQTEKYMEDLKKDSRFSDIYFKIDDAKYHTFKKMHVRYKDSLVNFNKVDKIDPKYITGKRLNPQEWKDALLDSNTVVIDARNDYEYDLGHFRGAIKPDIRYFRDLPNWFKENEDKFKGKKIITYCTGGIRCEKFTGWLVKEGYDESYQLHGGIHAYGTNEETKGELWDGKMYVFDERIGVDINKVNKTVIGKDYFTNKPCERYINCSNPWCNKQIIASKESEEKYLSSCSSACRLHKDNLWVKNHNLTHEEVVLIDKKLNM